MFEHQRQANFCYCLKLVCAGVFPSDVGCKFCSGVSNSFVVVV